MMSNQYVNVTQEQGRKFFTSNIEGEIVMLNLLRFKDTADFSSDPELKPVEPISGEKAYQIYMKHTTPFLQEAESELIFKGKAGAMLIGPEDEYWDLMLLVKHKSKEAFLEFANNKDYLKIAGYRTAALADSRLLPITV